MNNYSVDESLIRVEVSGEVLVVDEIERVCEESLNENVGQRANFPYGVSGVKNPQVFFEDESSFRGYVGDTVSPNGPLSCCCNLPGKASMCLNNVVLPGMERESSRGL